jgi:hypothetical protein
MPPPVFVMPSAEGPRLDCLGHPRTEHVCRVVVIVASGQGRSSVLGGRSSFGGSAQTAERETRTN